jgi:phosphate transport system substrate-binding protein
MEFKMKKVLVVMLFLTTNVLFSSEKKEIVLEGSTTVLPIGQKTAEEFMKLYPEINVSVRGGGSGVGITSLIEGNCDIAMSSREMKDSEKQKAINKNKKIKEFIIAVDGIAVIVNPKNPITNLTKQQIKDIYTGKISNWAEVGGVNKKIVVVSRDSAGGTFEAFNELALNGQRVRPDALMQASNRTVLNIVSKNSYAIGYVGAGFVSKDVRAVTVDNVSVNKTNVVNKKYVFSRPLFMYTNGVLTGNVKKYLDFVLSPQGQKIVEEMGFYSVK